MTIETQSVTGYKEPDGCGGQLAAAVAVDATLKGFGIEATVRPGSDKGGLKLNVTVSAADHPAALIWHRDNRSYGAVRIFLASEAT